MDPGAGRSADGLLQRIYAAGLELDAVLAEVDDETPAVSLRLAIGALDALADGLQQEALARWAPADLSAD